MIEATSARRGLLSRIPKFLTISLARVPRDGAVTEKEGLTEDQVRRIIAREGKGDSRRAIRVLARENQQARQRAQEAEKKYSDAEKAGRIAPEGAIIIQGDDAKAYPDLQKFMTDGKVTIKQVIELATKAPTLEAELGGFKKQSTIADAAKAVGFKGVAALAEIVETKKLELAERDMMVEGEKGKKTKESVWCVRKVGDDKGEWTPLEEYAETNLKMFLPALMAEGDEEEENIDRQQQTGRTTRQGAQQGEQGRQWPSQTRSKTPPTGTVKDEKELRDEAISTGIYNTL